MIAVVNRPSLGSRACAALFATSIALLGLATVIDGPPAASAAGPYGPSYRSCGSFQAEYHIRVYETHMSCHRAVRSQKEYWLAPPTRTVEVNHGGRPYVLLKRFPGWKCFSGAGGGTCNKGRKVAAYQD